MTRTIPSGYLSLEEAKAILGLLLIGPGWIGELTAREAWLVEKHRRRTGLFEPDFVSTDGVILHDRTTELGAALSRAESMESQHEQVEEWLEDRELLFESGDKDDDVIVPIKQFEAALRAAGLSSVPRNAPVRPPNASPAAQTGSEPITGRSPKTKKTPGPKPDICNGCKQKMLADLKQDRRTVEELKADSLPALVTEYGTSPNTAKKARELAIAEFAEFQRSAGLANSEH